MSYTLLYYLTVKKPTSPTKTHTFGYIIEICTPKEHD